MDKLKQALRSRTVWYAILIAILSVLQGFVFLLPVSPIEQMIIGLVAALGVIILRYITKEPLF